jgi:hypothetical protein
MPATAPSPQQKTPKSAQPTFWKRYSPRGECPISFTGSVLLHLLVLLIIAWRVTWWLVLGSLNSTPLPIDVVEIEGAGGGLGEIGSGPDASGKNMPKRTEAAQVAPIKKALPIDIEIAGINLKELPKDEIPFLNLDDLPEAKDGDPFVDLDRQRILGQAIVDSEARKLNAKPGGTGTGSGGKKGPGLGNRTGPGQGQSPVGKVLSDQRRRELRWKILASEDGDIHLKKLQALKVVLIIPLRTKPGMALRYDFSKANAQPQLVPAADDSNKVRWKNPSASEMMALAKVLHLQEVPQYSVIYLPPELEADMARRELEYKGLRENEIQMTVWDLRWRDGSFDNEPYIVEQMKWK